MEEDDRAKMDVLGVAAAAAPYLYVVLVIIVIVIFIKHDQGQKAV